MSSPTSPSPLTLRSFWHDLPREGKLLLSVVVFEFIGTGLVLPFNIVYLHEVRGFALSDAGLLLALPPLVGFLVVGPGGAAIDRWGARRILIGALVLQVIGNVVLAFASTQAVAAVALLLSGVAFGVSWPGFQAFIAAVIPSELRQRYFGVNFTLLNLGIGIGGLVAGMVVRVDHVLTFQVIYLGDALSYLPALFLMLVPLRHVAGRVEHHGDEPPAKVSYLDVVRRPAVASMLAISFVSSYVGYSQLNAGMPAYARSVGEVSTQGLGFAFAANTLVIVLARLVGRVVDSWLSGGRERDGEGGIGYFVVVMVLQIVFGLFASIIVSWFSRWREFRADAAGANLAGRAAMISALQRLSANHGETSLPQTIQAFGISGHLASGFKRLFMSHPPIEQRIAALQAAQ